MAGEENVKDNDAEIQILIKTIEIYNYGLRKPDHILRDGYFWDKFVEISHHVSSILPKLADPCLSDIDDLIMPNNTQPAQTLPKTYSMESIRLLVKSSIPLYRRLILSSDFLDPIYISPFIQLVEQSTAEEDEHFIIHMFIFASYLIKTLTITRICQALKIVRVILEKNIELIISDKFPKHNKSDLLHIMSWLSKLKNIPQAKCPKKQRITLWVARQSDISFGLMNLLHSDLVPNFSRELDAKSFVCNLMGYSICLFPLHLQHLFTYFMSTNDQNERVKLIEYFILGCEEAFKKAPATEYIWSYRVGYTKLPTGIKFLFHILMLVTFFKRSLGLISHLDAEVMEIEKCCRYQFEPYLSEYSSLTDIQSANDKLKSDKFNDMEENKELLENPDFTIERYLYYDDFMKSLQVMLILRDVFWKSADIFKMERFPEVYETLAFRDPYRYTLKDYIAFAIEKSNDYKALRFLHITLKVCPFLFLSKHHEYLLEDLQKLLNGEKLDEETLNELYFALQSKP